MTVESLVRTLDTGHSPPSPVEHKADSVSVSGSGKIAPVRDIEVGLTHRRTKREEPTAPVAAPVPDDNGKRAGGPRLLGFGRTAPVWPFQFASFRNIKPPPIVKEDEDTWVVHNPLDVGKRVGGIGAAAVPVRPSSPIKKARIAAGVHSGEHLMMDDSEDSTRERKGEGGSLDDDQSFSKRQGIPFPRRQVSFQGVGDGSDDDDEEEEKGRRSAASELDDLDGRIRRDFDGGVFKRKAKPRQVPELNEPLPADVTGPEPAPPLENKVPSFFQRIGLGSSNHSTVWPLLRSLSSYSFHRDHRLEVSTGHLGEMVVKGEEDEEGEEDLLERGYDSEDEAFLDQEQRGKLAGVETVRRAKGREWATIGLEGRTVRRWRSEGPRFDSEAVAASVTDGPQSLGIAHDGSSGSITAMKGALTVIDVHAHGPPGPHKAVVATSIEYVYLRLIHRCLQ